MRAPKRLSRKLGRGNLKHWQIVENGEELE